VSADGIAPDPAKVKAVKEWPRPKNLTELRAFTALAAYYRRHVKGFADIAKPLFILTQKNQPFVWTERQQQAFERLKECLTEAPVLATPLETGEYWLDTDASDVALGGVLQQMQNGELKVIAYASRVLSKSERSYSVTKREQLAVVYGLKQFRHFLLTKHFILRVDHAALTSLLKTPQPVGQSARWLDLIAEYDFEIRHRAGDLHKNADSLSRRPPASESNTEISETGLRRHLLLAHRLLYHWNQAPSPVPDDQVMQRIEKCRMNQANSRQRRAVRAIRENCNRPTSTTVESSPVVEVNTGDTAMGSLYELAEDWPDFVDLSRVDVQPSVPRPVKLLVKDVEVQARPEAESKDVQYTPSV
jgi:hypothetical protein